MTSQKRDVILNIYKSAIFAKNLILSIHTTQYRLTDWLPTSAKEVKALGWESIDVIIFSGDAYVDHPAQLPRSYPVRTILIPCSNELNVKNIFFHCCPLKKNGIIG
jgi:hypothetical protein